MKFRSSSSPAPFLNRRDQYRLLTLVAMLSMVMVAATAAKNPKNWYWLTGPPKNEQGQRQSVPDDSGEQQDAATQPVLLADDEFVSRRTGDGESSADQLAAVVPGAEVENEVAAVVPRDEADIAVDDQPKPLSPRLLKPINDHMVALQQAEVDVYYAVLRRLKGYSDEALQEAAEKGFTYPVFLSQPDLLRGRILSIEGELERLTPLPPPNDQPELDTMYEAWLFTRESTNNPIRVVLLDAGGIKPAEQFSPRPQVKFAGYFFKLYGYPTQLDELHRAPMFLARSLQKLPPLAVQANNSEFASYVFGVLMTFALSFAAIVAYLTFRDRMPRRRYREAAIAARPDEIAALKDIETFEVGDMLKRLADESPAEPTPKS